MKKKIFLATNGCSDSWNTVDYAAWMAKTFSMSITLLGIIEDPEDAYTVQEIFSKAIPHFQREGIEYDLQLINGDSETVLCEMKWGKDELLIISNINGEKDIPIFDKNYNISSSNKSQKLVKPDDTLMIEVGQKFQVGNYILRFGKE